jgi:hypothetical protein
VKDLSPRTDTGMGGCRCGWPSLWFVLFSAGQHAVMHGEPGADQLDFRVQPHHEVSRESARGSRTPNREPVSSHSTPHSHHNNKRQQGIS